jgi:hypothetical protein
MSPGRDSTPSQTDWLTVGRNVTQTRKNSSTRVEAGSNTSTVNLRVTGGDEKGSLKSETVKYGGERDSDPRKTKLTSVSSIYKRQTRPLVRYGSPTNQDRNCQKVINIWSWAPDGARQQDLLWLTVSRNVTMTLTYETVLRPPLEE